MHMFSTFVMVLTVWPPIRGKLLLLGAVLALAFPLQVLAADGGSPDTPLTLLAWIKGIGTNVSSDLERAAQILGALALVGSVAAAIVEMLKKFGRTWFQRGALFGWLGMEAKTFFYLHKCRRDTRLLDEFLYLAIGQRKHINVLCGQDLPKMMGQLQAAAKAALDSPDEYPFVYAFLLATDIEHPSDTQATDHVHFGRSKSDAQLWGTRVRAHRLSVKLGRAVQSTEMKNGTSGTPPAPTDDEGLTDAQLHSRISNQIMRKLDGFQLRTAFWWETTCQVLAIVISVALFWAAMGTLTWAHAGYALIGGLLAPFISNLASTIKGLAGRH
jgi:hypothetical protein